MHLGFIGTGQITKAVIKGIIASKIKIKKIYNSNRNKQVSKYLKTKSKKIFIIQDNQEILDKSKWIFLAVTPSVGNKIIKNLKFKSSHTIISFISTMTLPDLKKNIKVKAKITRAIPLPPISLMKGPVPIFPSNLKVRNFFNKLGSSIEISNENLSKNFWATSGMMASFYELLSLMSNWLIKRGVKKNQAQDYVTSLYLALSEYAVLNTKKDLRRIVKDSQTPNGLNEQGVRELKKRGFFKLTEKTLNSILKRLNKV